MDPSIKVGIWCPISPAINPQWRVWERSTVSWIERLQFDDEQSHAGRLRSIGVGELAGRVLLGATNPVAAQFGTDSLAWLFAFDDAYCDEGRYSRNPAEMAILVAEMIRIAETGHTTSSSPCARGLADLRQRLEGITSPVPISRWVRSMRGYLGYQVWEAAHRCRQSLPTINEYAVARIRSGSVELCAMSLDISEGYEVPAEEMETADVRALTEAMCLLVGLDNDIVSYHKERRRSGDKINMIHVIAHERGQEPDEALTEAVAFRDALLTLFLKLRSQVEPTASAATRRYISGLSAWIRGNLDWSTHTARYRDPGQENIQVVDVPSRPAQEFSPPDGVSWWWSRPTAPEFSWYSARPQ